MPSAKSALLAATLVALSQTSAWADDLLSGAELKAQLPGKYHVVVTPSLSIELAIVAGGTVSGVASNGEKDKGKWRIDGNKVCATFSHWLDKKENCTTVSRQGAIFKGDAFSAWRK